MKHLLLFEDLESDFLARLEELPQTKYNLKYQCTKFLNELPTQELKSEFMYRVGDGEDVVKLFRDMLDRKELSQKQTTFYPYRIIVLDYELNNLKSENEREIKVGMDLLEHAILGQEKLKEVVDQLNYHIEESEIDPTDVKEILNGTINFLKNMDSLYDWAYGETSSANVKKIRAAKDILRSLKSFE